MVCNTASAEATVVAFGEELRYILAQVDPLLTEAFTLVVEAYLDIVSRPPPATSCGHLRSIGSAV